MKRRAAMSMKSMEVLLACDKLSAVFQKKGIWRMFSECMKTKYVSALRIVPYKCNVIVS